MILGLSGPRSGSTLEEIKPLLASRGLHLVRSWPRSGEHLLIEAAGPSGTVAGQWFASPARAAHVAGQTPGAEHLDSLVLQPRGADRRLPSLSRYVTLRGTVLVAHRPERRAVLRSTATATRSAPVVFTKMVPASKAADLARTMRLAAALPVRTPQLLAVDAAAGVVSAAALPGVALHHLLRQEGSAAACHATGAALARLHRAPPPSGLTRHGLGDERRVVERWRQLAESHGLRPAPHSPDEGEAMFGEAEVPTEEQTLIHRDFHDKQVLIDATGEAGLLDFDLMALGDPMLDLANLLVHLELRVAQGVARDAPALRAAVLGGYAPAPAQLRRLSRYEQTARDRLAAVYAFREDGALT